MTKILERSDAAVKVARMVSIVEDFVNDLDTNQWTTTASDSGAITVGDVARGTASLAPSDGSVGDNDEIYLLHNNEPFKFAADKPIYAAARIQFSEANTNDANVAFGLMNAVAANSIQDNGAGPKADYSGATIYKVDGETVWRCQNSVGTTQKTTTTTTTAGGSSYQTLEIEVIPQTSSKFDVVFRVDGEEVAKHKDQALGSPTEMTVFVGVKNGDTNLETLVVDWIVAEQLR